MEMMTRLQEIYEAYFEKAAKVYKAASPVAGLFGMGDDPRRHYCHEEYYELVGQWVEEFRRSGPDAQAVAAAVRYILVAASEHRDEEVYWYLYAAHGHVRSLIPLLSTADSAALAELYDDLYPRLDRMPVQKEIYKMLQKGRKQKNRLF